MWDATTPADLFATYASARKGALAALVQRAPALAASAGARWTCGGGCRDVFERTGCLYEPLELPHVLLLPIMPFLDGVDVVPPLQTRVDAGYWNAWWCHGYCNMSVSLDRRRLAEPTHAHWREVQRYMGPAAWELRRCWKPKSSETTYVCDCARVAAQRLVALASAVVPERGRPTPDPRGML